MPLRELTDRSGVAWKVWDITPDQLHPSTRSGDYLQGFLDGWLVFQTRDGTRKRRLYPVPVGWEELGDEELERLCERADPVRGGPGSRPHASDRATAPAAPAATHPVTRTFLFPGGRVWTVAERLIPQRPAAGAPSEGRTVLRFTSGVRALDLHAWPREWREYTDEQLADLLSRAFPREQAGTAGGALRRRRSDQRA